jgi:hypothetical protein
MDQDCGEIVYYCALISQCFSFRLGVSRTIAGGVSTLMLTHTYI